MLCCCAPRAHRTPWQAFRSGAANAMVFVLHKGEAKAIAAHLSEALADLADADQAAHDASDDDDADDDHEENNEDEDEDGEGEEGAGAGSGAWVVALQGDMSSTARARALDRFRAGQAKVRWSRAGPRTEHTRDKAPGALCPPPRQLSRRRSFSSFWNDPSCASVSPRSCARAASD